MYIYIYCIHSYTTLSLSLSLHINIRYSYQAEFLSHRNIFKKSWTSRVWSGWGVRIKSLAGSGFSGRPVHPERHWTHMIWVILTYMNYALTNFLGPKTKTKSKAQVLRKVMKGLPHAICIFYTMYKVRKSHVG